MESSSQPLTINGIHLGPYGDQQIGALLDAALFGPRPAETIDLEKLRAEVNEKNLQHFYDYRAVNGYYIYGDRKNAFSAVNFPPEFAKLRQMVANRDRRIWAVAQGKPVSEHDRRRRHRRAADDRKRAGPGDGPDQESRRELCKLSRWPTGTTINLFASEVEFPDLRNPVAITFDARGRLWVATMATFPMYLPGKPVDDKILIFEDTDADGRADRQIVFADGLHVPTGLELGDGGVYVAQQPNLVFLQDTDGDDRADVKQIVLGGFDTADSHHSLHTFVWDPGGGLHFQEGLFNFTQVESLMGRFASTTRGSFASSRARENSRSSPPIPLATPGGITSIAGARISWPMLRAARTTMPPHCPATSTILASTVYLKSFLTKQWRPTCGCELVSSRNFPDEIQGDYLLNNIIGFQGVLHYKMREEGSGFAADPSEPLLAIERPQFSPGRFGIRTGRRALPGRFLQSDRRPHDAFDARSQSRSPAWPHLAGRLQESAARRARQDRRRVDRATFGAAESLRRPDPLSCAHRARQPRH